MKKKIWKIYSKISTSKPTKFPRPHFNDESLKSQLRLKKLLGEGIWSVTEILTVFETKNASNLMKN